MAQLPINPAQVERLKQYAAQIAAQLDGLIDSHSTVSIERSLLRLCGVDGITEDKTPLPNVLTDKLAASGQLASGVFRPFVAAMYKNGLDAQTTAERIAEGKLAFGAPSSSPEKKQLDLENKLACESIARLDQSARHKTSVRATFPPAPEPLRYIIVATGNIHEDCRQATSAVQAGADIVAVIRSTAQSLLDYVPFGPTTKGFGGTYATQANFRIMRKALDAAGSKVNRYIRLVNYASGLCMPEIAVCAAFEHLDILLNDALYGVLFRDINMQRTFVDQYFSRLICARARIMINTGEDNYLTTADALEKAYTVTASQLINEALARKALLTEDLMGLGHAFEINPATENAFLLEVAHAQLARQLFPKAPLKYMPPTKYKSTDIFHSHCMDTLFNLASVITHQGIHLTGILTEALHTPLMQDRFQSLVNVDYVFSMARNLGDEIEFKSNGLIVKQAQKVLDRVESFLKTLTAIGLTTAIEQGMFADIKRSPEKGKGREGIFPKAKDYVNPILDLLVRKGGCHDRADD